MPKIMPTAAVISPAAGSGDPEGEPDPEHQDGRGVGADAHEGPVPQGDLPGEAGQQVEPEGADDGDADQVDQVHDVVELDRHDRAERLEQEREAEQEGEEDAHRDLDEGRLEDGHVLAVADLEIAAVVAIGQTLSISSVPKSP